MSLRIRGASHRTIHADFQTVATTMETATPVILDVIIARNARGVTALMSPSITMGFLASASLFAIVIKRWLTGVLCRVSLSFLRLSSCRCSSSSRRRRDAVIMGIPLKIRGQMPFRTCPTPHFAPFLYS
ncbi:hypothetical protein BDW59DRAFT_152947 [Aspergillus cavernicola]|uniref:Uncharacterized protein n=1 Tax=Aspergillus cavernicola TaxID=176166 RepID=A0ABR4HNF6_9EURO